MWDMSIEEKNPRLQNILRLYSNFVIAKEKLSILEEEEKSMLIQHLKKNSDVFSWSTIDMQGVDPWVIVHKLNVLSEAKFVKEKRRKFASQVVEAVR